MPKCRCGAFVTSEYVRVMGDNYGVVWACPECSVQGIGDLAGKEESE